LRGRGIEAAATLACLDFLNGARRDDPHHTGAIERFRSFVASHHAGPAAVDELDQIVRLADGTPAQGRIQIDPSLARGLSYYTGAIMEIAVADLPGSLGGGGRYDNLVGRFLGREVPACGFSLGLERIIVVMTERGMFPAKVSRSAVDVMVTFLSDDLRTDALMLATELRAEKLRVEVYPEASRRVDKPLKYASNRHVPVLVILGEDERARQEVAVRDLQTRQQDAVPRDAAAAAIAARVRIDR
jgi:histidyl-tRNA synthetase